MEVYFENEILVTYYEGSYKGKQNFSESTLDSFRKVIDKMLNSDNINVLSKFKGLNIEKYENRWSARINHKFRLEFDFIKPNTIVVIKISNHYEK
jgi:Txe/YoeB family toxin of Txe-Axe toxin-antitoxin module